MQNKSKINADYWIKKLSLIRHEEGGYYREVYRASEQIQQTCLPNRFSGSRPFGTSIYFLLDNDQISTMHRLQADEIWHFYAGSSLTIYIINPQGICSHIFLGNDFENGEAYQAVVTAGSWFGAKLNKTDAYALVGCTMAPGFDYNDFELGNRGELIKKFPQHREIIEMLTRGA